MTVVLAKQSTEVATLARIKIEVEYDFDYKKWIDLYRLDLDSGLIEIFEQNPSETSFSAILRDWADRSLGEEEEAGEHLAYAMYWLTINSKVKTLKDTVELEIYV